MHIYNGFVYYVDGEMRYIRKYLSVYVLLIDRSIEVEGHTIPQMGAMPRKDESIAYAVDVNN